MPEPPYRALSILLRVFSLLAALGGLLLIFAEKALIVRILLRPPEGEVSMLFLSTLKEMGGMMLMLGILLWFASRNPVRNVAVVDAFIAGLCILALTPLLSLWLTDIRSIYPGYLRRNNSIFPVRGAVQRNPHATNIVNENSELFRRELADLHVALVEFRILLPLLGKVVQAQKSRIPGRLGHTRHNRCIPPDQCSWGTLSNVGRPSS
jgi:hypothetical protein